MNCYGCARGLLFVSRNERTHPGTPLGKTMKATNKPLANPQPCRRLLLSALACLCAGAAIAQPTISTNFALPSSAGDTTKPGFVWRIHQVSTNVPNSNLRTEQQLAGAMGD